MERMDEREIRRRVHARYKTARAALATVTAERDRLRAELDRTRTAVAAQMEIVDLAEQVIAIRATPAGDAT